MDSIIKIINELRIKMRTVEELLEEIEVDNKMSPTNLEGEILRVPQLVTKYMRWHRQYKEVLIKAWSRQKALEIEKQQYYSGSATDAVYRKKPFNLTIKNAVELKRWIESDEDVRVLEMNIKATEDCMEMVEQMLEALKYRPNHIATILEIRKFEAGV